MPCLPYTVVAKRPVTRGDDRQEGLTLSIVHTGRRVRRTFIATVGVLATAGVSLATASPAMAEAPSPVAAGTASTAQQCGWKWWTQEIPQLPFGSTYLVHVHNPCGHAGDRYYVDSTLMDPGGVVDGNGWAEIDMGTTNGIPGGAEALYIEHRH